MQGNRDYSAVLRAWPPRTVWIRPWKREIGQALVAPDVVSGKTALRAELGNEVGGEISNPDASPRLLMRYFLEVENVGSDLNRCAVSGGPPVGRVGQSFSLGGLGRNKVCFVPRQNLAQADGLLMDPVERDAAWRRPPALKHAAVLGDHRPATPSDEVLRQQSHFMFTFEPTPADDCVRLA
jgi:hypothetical protein